MIHYPRDRTTKLVIRFEAEQLFSRGYFLKRSHLAIPARLHCPKGGQINESLLYNHVCIQCFQFRIAVKINADCQTQKHV